MIRCKISDKLISVARSRTWLTSDRFEWDTDCGAAFMEAALAAEMAGSPSDDIVEMWLSGSPLCIWLIVCINSQRSATTTRRKRDTTFSWSRYLFQSRIFFLLPVFFLSIVVHFLHYMYIIIIKIYSFSSIYTSYYIIIFLL